MGLGSREVETNVIRDVEGRVGRETISVSRRQVDVEVDGRREVGNERGGVERSPVRADERSNRDLGQGLGPGHDRLFAVDVSQLDVSVDPVAMPFLPSSEYYAFAKHYLRGLLMMDL